MTLKRLATIGAVLVFGLAAFSFGRSADAATIVIGSGYGYSGYGYSGYGVAPGYGYRVRSYGIAPYRAPLYRRTTIYRHYDHYHVVPSRPVYRSGYVLY